MKLQSFETERFFARYEFSATHLLSVSDCETVTIETLLELANMNLSNLGGLSLGYTESQGNPALRAAIAKNYPSVTPEDVLVLGSPIEGLFISLQALLDKQDEVIILTPAYDALFNLPEDLAGKAIPWELKATENSWQLDLDRLESLITSQTKVIVVNFPHNPTGFLPTPAEFHKLIELAQKNDLWLLCDEMYKGLEHSETKPLTSATDLYDKAIILSGLSKTHGLPGLRAGWLILKDKEMFQAILNWKLYTSICPPAPTEFLALAALKAADKLRQKNLEIITKNLELAQVFFKRWDELFIYRKPRAGSTALVELRRGRATEYCHSLALEASIVLLPSPFMRFPDRFVRFGLGRESFQAALTAYDKHLSSAG
ncbi:MAG: pyridoxal phosphate-dependent aminotransferase [Trueperaceae bacterium]|nr:pyridoxal phosphate-dependent aminotransferase [Trueperaceae bacterium]